MEEKVGISAVVQATASKTIAFGTTALYYAAVPLALYVAVTRRDLAWTDVAKAALRLPFA